VADETTPPEDETPETPEAPEEQPAAEGGEESPQANAPEGAADEPAADEPPEEAAAAEPVAETPAEAAGESGGPEEPEAGAEEAGTAETPEAAPAAEAEAAEGDDEDDEPAKPREKPAIPGMDLEVDIVAEGEEALRGGSVYGDEEDLHDAAEEQLAAGDDRDIVEAKPIVSEINLAADARYTATGKRKTAIARVILKPGTGAYTINGKELDAYFPRATLQRNIRQPLETVGYETRMDVVARMDGGGVSAQADALRHGISRALIEADPNLRGELKRRGFLTRDARAKERKKAGLKKARKRPQFSKR
jgi:small subunit ribosomal protein S9